MLVLSRVEVSFAYPFLSVGYIVTAVAGYAVFNEQLSLTKIMGIALICLGVILIAGSGGI
jgi:multidrug transporter EmrE-like cation transporter